MPPCPVSFEGFVMIVPQTTPTESSFRTDTATLAVFDAILLTHRQHDDADWWSIPDDEVAEINAGNVLFVSTGCDGDYLLNVYRESPPQIVLPIAISALIRCESGSLFFHAGEYVRSGDLMPDTKYGGFQLAFNIGVYRVTVVHLMPFSLEVFVVPSDEVAINHFTDSPAIPWPITTNNQLLHSSPRSGASDMEVFIVRAGERRHSASLIDIPMSVIWPRVSCSQ